MSHLLCGSDGGNGFGHGCTCLRPAGHSLNQIRPHGCGCGARWGCPDCVGADELEGCAGCGAHANPFACETEPHASPSPAPRTPAAGTPTDVLRQPSGSRPVRTDGSDATGEGAE